MQLKEITTEHERIIRLLFDARSILHDYRVADLLTALAACVNNPALNIREVFDRERETQIKKRGY